MKYYFTTDVFSEIIFVKYFDYLTVFRDVFQGRVEFTIHSIGAMDTQTPGCACTDFQFFPRHFLGNHNLVKMIAHQPDRELDEPTAGKDHPKGWLKKTEYLKLSAHIEALGAREREPKDIRIFVFRVHQCHLILII